MLKEIKKKIEEKAEEFKKLVKQRETLQKGLKQLNINIIQIQAEYKALKDLLPEETKEKK